MNKEEKGTVLDPMREAQKEAARVAFEVERAAEGKDFSPQALRSAVKILRLAAQQRAETPPEREALAKRVKELAYEMGRDDVDVALSTSGFRRQAHEAAKETAREFEAAVDALATPPERAETPPDERDAQIERLKIRGEAYENAYRIALAATYQSHTGHWDKTGGSGSGCPECIRASEARENCDAAIREGLEKLAARALATPPERAETPEPKIVCWWNGLAEEDERDLTGPSYSQKEDTWHDIPLVAISNPCNERAETPPDDPVCEDCGEQFDPTIAKTCGSPDPKRYCSERAEIPPEPLRDEMRIALAAWDQSLNPPNGPRLAAAVRGFLATPPERAETPQASPASVPCRVYPGMTHAIKCGCVPEGAPQASPEPSDADKRNIAVALMILRNDRAEAVKWARDLLLPEDGYVVANDLWTKAYTEGYADSSANRAPSAQAKGAAQPDPADPSVHSTERDGEAVQRPVGGDAL